MPSLSPEKRSFDIDSQISDATAFKELMDLKAQVTDVEHAITQRIAAAHIELTDRVDRTTLDRLAQQALHLQKALDLELINLEMSSPSAAAIAAFGAEPLDENEAPIVANGIQTTVALAREFLKSAQGDLQAV